MGQRIRALQALPLVGEGGKCVLILYWIISMAACKSIGATPFVDFGEFDLVFFSIAWTAVALVRETTELVSQSFAAGKVKLKELLQRFGIGGPALIQATPPSAALLWTTSCDAIVAKERLAHFVALSCA